MSDQRHIEAFLEMLVAERGRARLTIEAYRRDLADFTGFLARRGGAATTADSDAIRDYLSDLAARVTPATSARRLSALRGFHRFLFAEGVRSDDPTAAIDSPRTTRPLPKLLSEDEVDALLEAARATDGPKGLRLAALVELIYATGLRVSELVGLPLAAVRGDPRFIVVRGKGAKARRVPVGEMNWLARIVRNNAERLSAMSTDERASLDEAIRIATEPYRDGDVYVIRSHARLCIGTKPG